MDTKKSHSNEIGNGDVTGEEKKLTILVISMLTIVLALYGIIPFVWSLS